MIIKCGNKRFTFGMGNIYEVCGAWKENQQRSQIMQDVENKIYVFFSKMRTLDKEK
jgi:hypothetical protein